jgi:hypothetical protein
MRQSSSNPSTNALPPGLDEKALVEAVEVSGYPLQGIVAEKLELAGFEVIEEWGFIDKDTGEHRSLDLLALKRFAAIEDATIGPRLALLIECKRSIHPYVFFKKVSKVSTAAFPVVSGVEVSIGEPSGVGSRSYPSAPGQMVLDLKSLPFLKEPPLCASFSRATISGKKVDLSGDELFRGIILPLVKSLQFKVQLDNGLLRLARPAPTLVLCIGVLDAPLLVVESPNKAGDPVLTPWVRVLRLQANQDLRKGSHDYYGIDVIHIGALESFLTDQLGPFAEEFARRAVALGSVWKKGGVVSNLDDFKWNEIKPRPE